MKFVLTLVLLMPALTDGACITSCTGLSTTDGKRYPDCSDCAYYIRCEPSGLQRKKCPTSLAFNSVAGNCDHPANAVCGTTTTTTTSTTTTTTSTTTTSGPFCVSSCVGRPVGNERYPHCTSCSKYVQCLATGMKVTTCPSGLHHNDANDDCDTVSNAACTITSPTTAATSATTKPALATSSTFCLKSCVGMMVSNERYPYCGDCTKYIQCLSTGQKVTTCPAGLHHNDIIDDCDQPSTANCQSDSVGTSGTSGTTGNCVATCSNIADGNYQDCTDCYKYVACSGGLMYVMDCAANLVWDDSMKQCEGTSSTCTSIG